MQNATKIQIVPQWANLLKIRLQRLSNTTFTRWRKHKANVFKIHVHDECSTFASCLLHRVNRV